jgi:phage gpG-like protein
MIRVVIVGAEAVIHRLEEVPPRVLGLVRQAVMAETINLVREAKQKVSGPVLKTKTGTLRRGVNAAFEDTDTSIVGSAGIGKAVAKYPAVHEYGGTFTIREHTRRMTMAWGRAVANPRQISVRAHTATYPERSYLRSSLRENEARIKAAIDAAVSRGVKG